MPNKIFVVDDNKEILDVVNIHFSAMGYDVTSFEDGKKLLDYLYALDNDSTSKVDPDAVILDMHMPEMSGIEVSKHIRARYRFVPIIGITKDISKHMQNDFLKRGFCDIIQKPVVADYLLLKTSQAIENAKIPSYEIITNALISTVGDMGNARDANTHNHNKRIGEMAYLLAKFLGFDETKSKNLQIMSTTHDIGKIAIPDAILRKPGPLTDEEYTIMKTHTTEGAKLLKNLHENVSFEYVKMMPVIALQHHEKMDGSGYPYGLLGENISLEARIVCVVDIYDAVTSKRPYHGKRSHKYGAKVLLNDAKSGKIDKTLVDAFLKIEPEIRTVKDMYH